MALPSTPSSVRTVTRVLLKGVSGFIKLGLEYVSKKYGSKIVKKVSKQDLK